MAAQCLLRPKRVLFLGHNSNARLSCRTHGIGNAGLDPLLVSFGCAGTIGACLLFAQAVIRDFDLQPSVDGMFLQIGGNDLNSATCVPTQLARYILHVARDSIKLGGVERGASVRESHSPYNVLSIWLLLLYSRRTLSSKTYVFS